MKTIPDLQTHALELVRRASTVLPADVERALVQRRDAEEPGSAAYAALETLLANTAQAREGSTPICQDTGTPLFFIHHPWDYPTAPMSEALRAAVAEATERTYLRPNAVNSVTGANSGNNIGDGLPSFHFHQWDRDEVRVELLLKGGGSENVSTQYALPHGPTGAGRDLEGVRRVVLDAVVNAQGKGCGPGVLGVCVGGDRGAGYLAAKEQLLRPLDDTNHDPALAELEAKLLEQGNSLGIGPMGFGGATTLLAVKVAQRHRLPASYFVTVAYLCWAARRASMTLAGGEVQYD